MFHIAVTNQETMRFTMRLPATRAFTDFSASRPIGNNSNSPLLQLPDKVLTSIMGHAGPVDGTILGLTHSRLYTISKTVFPKVSLYDESVQEIVCQRQYLWERLDAWMGERIFCVFADGGPKFTTGKRARELEDDKEDCLWTREGFGANILAARERMPYPNLEAWLDQNVLLFGPGHGMLAAD